MARNIPAAPSLKRSVQTIDPKVEIYIVCEGKNTEPTYFESCANYYGNGLVKVKPLPGAGVPLTIVQTAKDLKEKLTDSRNKQKIKNSFDSCFRVWAVFDRDEHPEVERALAIAAESKIDVGFSNPCFEIWPLLHLIEYGSQDGRHAVQKRLSSEMPNYDHERAAIIDFDLIKENFGTALIRANKLQAAREAENCIHGCPSTNIGKLVEKIVQNGKKGTKKL
ncbi:RloB family protein [Pseudomonas sp. 910_21]|uniref:RloB family protein n=1 Tax=Pseudomonas sp. 910_21 TaxID=2604460 RepID=UPI004063885A